jgi:hypothetical protein
MQTVTTTSARNPLWKRVAAALLLVAFLGINAVSVSHSLHSQVHHDAGSANHDCVFIQISHGQCLVDTVPVSAPTPLVIEVAAVSLATISILSSRDYVLLPGRAPPVSLV